MKIIRCQKCGKVYPKKLSNCPKCFEKNKNYISKGRKAAGIIILVLGVFLLVGAVINWDETSINTPNDSSVSSTTVIDTENDTKNNNNQVNYENFKKIENGMTYDQVVNIFGSEGKILSESDMGLGDEYVSVVYYWYDNTGIANCNVMFQGGKVISKAQVGLK